MTQAEPPVAPPRVEMPMVDDPGVIAIDAYAEGVRDGMRDLNTTRRTLPTNVATRLDTPRMFMVTSSYMLSYPMPET